MAVKKKRVAKTNYTKGKTMPRKKVSAKKPCVKKGVKQSVFAKDLKNASNVIVTNNSIITNEIVTKKHAKTKSNVALLKRMGG